MGKAAADANRDNVFVCDAYSGIDTGDDTDNNAKRPGQPHNYTTNNNDNYKVEEAGGHKSAMGCRAAKKRPYSPQDYSTNDSVDEEARSTGADEGAPKAAYAAAAWGAAARGAATQRGKGDPRADHKATSEADQVKGQGLWQRGQL
jgi:hypothetical protein